MWIEMSGFRQLRIVKNFQRTKHILLGFMLSLYMELLVIGLILGEYRLLQVCALFYVVFLVVTFLFGSSAMYKVLNTARVQPYAHQKGATQNTDEIRRIFSTTTTVCLASILFLFCEVFYLVTFQLRIPEISFFTFNGFLVCILCLEIAVLWQLKGATVIPWHFLPCFNGIIERKRSTTKSQIIKVAPWRDGKK